MLGVTCIDQKHLKAALVEQFKNRHPVDAGRFHDDRLDPAFRKPISQSVQISSESPKPANRVGGAVRAHRRHVHGGADIDAAAFGLTTAIPECVASDFALRFISILLLTKAEGLDCAVGQFPKRDRPKTSPLSSSQQSMDHVFLRSHSPPKSGRPLPSAAGCWMRLRSGYALPASHPTPGELERKQPGGTPLIIRGKLFRQPGPALPSSVPAPAAARVLSSLIRGI